VRAECQRASYFSHPLPGGSVDFANAVPEDETVQLRGRAPKAVAIGALLALLAAAPAPAAAGEEENAADLEARTYFVQGEFTQALEIYTRLYVETMHPTYLRNIGRCQQNLGEPDKAIASFREYLRKSKNLPADQRAEIEGYIAEMEQLKKAKAAGESKPAGEGAPPPAAAAERAPAAPAPAAQPAPLVGPPTVVAASRADDSDGGPFYTRAWFWIGVGVVAAGAVTAAVLLSADRSPAHGNLGFYDARSMR
jgi:tetratricopeptide (TPR) repeat protein